MRNNRGLYAAGAAMGLLALIFDGKTALSGGREGIELCLNVVIPSLFPFFVLTPLLTGTLSDFLKGPLRPVGRWLGMPSGSESLLVAAFLGGYPVGAQAVADAWKDGLLTKDTAQRLLSFSNNGGPAFLFGMLPAFFSERKALWFLWGIHILSAFLAGVLLSGPTSSTGVISSGESISLTMALNRAVRTSASVCGWVILFRILIRFLERWILWILPAFWRTAVMGLLELSNGCCELGMIESPQLRFVLASVLLALGGLCVGMQTRTVTQGLSLGLYYRGKLLQGIFSLVLSGLLVFRVRVFFVVLPVLLLAVSIKTRNKYSFQTETGV